MRLDKFLKEARIIKRRTIAQQLAKNGKIIRNNIALKPASEIRSGDELELFLRGRFLKIKVLSEKEYEVIEEKKIWEDEI
ncbi:MULTISPECIES: S4 domain-containing protein [unclassified Thermosipho (in: thermotogales)]|uniref:S4 domain-containing protein n=1 Tax=unclassified Thermosipho (in: thermotogales) TaxID=2676525 RepID=UPI000986FD77|nr:MULTISPECIES: S4 domain-containing protein [unclassified Thermosipho (in: thermotogales)]MBT1247468.1 RNA-binding protein [Thermosipho sp. 1244]OOC46283.1 tRNA synthetase RNA-binding protein [Thermosipho sp. 1223]